MRSENKGNIARFGFAPEGIENNEVIYELLIDAGWTEEEIDLDRWLEHYSICRYGSSPQGVKDYWSEIRKGVYGSFTDHPRYMWQSRPGETDRGSIQIDVHLYKAIKSFASAAGELSDSPLYAVDLEELTAQYLGARIEEELQAGDPDRFCDLAVTLDKVLASHPNLRLDKWVDYARKWGTKEEESD